MTGAQVAPLLDTSACEQEPIQTPGSIQPHGLLMALRPEDLAVQQVSANSPEILGLPVDQVLGKTPEQLLPGQFARLLIDGMAKLTPAAWTTYLTTGISEKTGVALTASAHCYDGALILELERVESLREPAFEELYPLVTRLADRLRGASAIDEIAQLATEEIRRITNFDRVLTYKFDENWNGNVIGESRSEALPSYLNLWFPAADIPLQARRLYELNRQRLIVDVNYLPVPLVPAENPATKRAPDLSMAVLRSVSPTHLQYLRNMGVGGSMSVSLQRANGRLWGLMACHHKTPHAVPVAMRAACDLTSKLVAAQIEVIEQRLEQDQRLRCRKMTTQVLTQITHEGLDLAAGLMKDPQPLLRFADADGFAVVVAGECKCTGSCPSQAEIRKLVEWLNSSNPQEVFSTDKLSSHFPEADGYHQAASGLLAISVSKSHKISILWFRREAVGSVNWGGDPYKAVPLSPRTSFESWKEVTGGSSRPWLGVEVEAAAELRGGMIEIAFSRAEEMADLSAELKRSNKDLEAFSYSVSHDLRAPFRHIVGYAELLTSSATAVLSDTDRRYVDIIVKQAHYAGTLVDNLLSFSQVGRALLKPRQIDMGLLLLEVKRDLQGETQGRKVTWSVGDLPNVRGDPLMLRLVWQNLLHNALKYSRRREQALIAVECRSDGDEYVFSVKDNGVGFDPAYAGKLFTMFQRLHKVEEFEGTGIGLANVRRIITRHGGRTWAESEPDKGAEFFFTLPKGGFVQ